MMLTAAVTLVMATTTTRAVSSDDTDSAKTVHSCDEPALDRKYDNCVAMLHTGTETLNDRPRAHFLSLKLQDRN